MRYMSREEGFKDYVEVKFDDKVYKVFYKKSRHSDKLVCYIPELTVMFACEYFSEIDEKAKFMIESHFLSQQEEV